LTGGQTTAVAEASHWQIRVCAHPWRVARWQLTLHLTTPYCRVSSEHRDPGIGRLLTFKCEVGPMAKPKTPTGKSSVRASRGKLPSARARLKICGWINDQFETSVPTQLATPPAIGDCAVWTCAPASGVDGVVCLAGRTAYYSAATGSNQTTWWRMGAVPASKLS
jgi:hypothetical protein